MNKRILMTGLGFVGWVLVYVYQDFDLTRMKFMFNQYAEGFIPEGEEWRFAINKTWRFLFNDLFSLLIIYGLFPDKQKMRIALLVLLFGLLVLLPVYLILAVTTQERSFNVLVFLHRLTMNPWLMILLIPAFYYQKLNSKTA